jgi:CRISPR system Cascade subunit CasE
MIVLSRLILNLRDSRVRRELGDCHSLHTRLLSAFPAVPHSQGARDYFGILFRAEPLPEYPLAARLLVQSTHTPNWSCLPTGYLAPPDERGNLAMRPVDEEYARITNAMTLRFRLRANPTKRVSNRNGSEDTRWHGKRVELRSDEDRQAWLERKGEQSGFHLLRVQARPELANVRLSPQPNARGRRPANGGEGSMPLTFGAALFEGLLEVTDADRFRQTLVEGIGSGKAYGFGLLSIATR